MKGKFDAYVLWPLTKRFQNWIVDRSAARDFRVSIKFPLHKHFKRAWVCYLLLTKTVYCSSHLYSKYFFEFPKIRQCVSERLMRLFFFSYLDEASKFSKSWPCTLMTTYLRQKNKQGKDGWNGPLRQSHLAQPPHVPLPKAPFAFVRFCIFLYKE